MALFVEVARTSNFSRAGANLEIPTPTLSRGIASMERELGVRLFDRTTRRVELTDAGRRYFERCAPLVDAARMATEALREMGERPSGNVRLSMPADFGVHVAAPILADFARAYPAISLELDLSPRHTDLIGEHVDFAIRLGVVHGGRLIARRIGWLARSLFASPGYLDLHPSPTNPAELAEHECIVLGPQQSTTWSLLRDAEETDVAIRGRICANNHSLVCGFAERGLGICALTPALLRESLRAGRLVPVLPDWTLRSLPIHAVTTSRLQPAAVRALLEFLQRHVSSF